MRPDGVLTPETDLSSPRPGKEKVRFEILQQGGTPPCTKGSALCRGCSGWLSMVRGAFQWRLWRAYPLHCPCTGLTVRVVGTECAREESFRIRLNGKEKEVPAGTTVEELLRREGKRGSGVIVERNGRLVHSSEYPKTVLEEGDRISFIDAAFGG